MLGRKKKTKLALSIPLEEFILLILGQGKQMTGNDLRDRLSSGLKRPVTSGALYTTLKRLEEKRLLTKAIAKKARQGAKYAITNTGVEEITYLANIRVCLIHKTDEQSN